MEFDFEDEQDPAQAKGQPKKRFRKNKLKVVFDSDERKKFLLGFRKRKQERKDKYIEKLERNLEKEKQRIKQETKRAAKKLSNSHSVLPEVKNLIESMPEKEETFDLGNTLVSITSLDDQIYRNLPTIKEEDEEESEDGECVSSNKPRKRTSFFDCSDDDSEDDDDDKEKIKKIVKSDPFFNPINDDELMQNDVSSDDEKELHYDPLEMLRRSTEGSSDATNQEGMTKSKLEREANRMLQHSDVFKKMQRIKQKKSKKFRMFRLQPSEDASAGDGSGSRSSKSKAGGKVKGKSIFRSGKKGKKGKKGK